MESPAPTPLTSLPFGAGSSNTCPSSATRTAPSPAMEISTFLAGWMEKKDYEHAFHMGIAAGSASAFSENLATKEEIEAVYRQITEK